MLAAHLIGQTRSFMTFFSESEMQVILSRTAVTAGLVAVGVTLFANLSPGFGAVRKTIVSYRQQRARQDRLPWWQRIGLDFLLLIPAVFSIYLIRKPGTLMNGDSFNNPSLFLAPALFILALTLLFLRLIPPLMAGVARLFSFTTWVGPTMAARYLSRNPGSFNTPLVILILTLSLSAYTSSIAQTLDLHLYDQTYYKVGSDLRFVESGRRETSGNKISYYFTPVNEYLKVNGVNAASRVGEYPTGIEVKVGGMISGRFMGIDPGSFRKVAFWRSDFAGQNLENLMSKLANRPDGVLATNSFLSKYGFKVGDTVNLVVNTFERNTRQDFTIVGSFDLFPTWYPDEGPLFVGNLDYLFTHAGETYPYQVWLKTAADAENSLPANIKKVNPAPASLESAPLNIAKAQRKPERQGALGILFIGFAAAALLTVIGFLLYVVFSFRQRFIELGVLRASGLSIGQMTAYITSELAALMLLGGLAGTIFGTTVSRIFIPYLQIGVSAADQVPPFVVLIAWPAISQIYTLFAVLFIVTLLILIFSLWHIKIFQAIKLGETV
jgi:putative ABC transport system permease protein